MRWHVNVARCAYIIDNQYAQENLGISLVANRDADQQAKLRVISTEVFRYLQGSERALQIPKDVAEKSTVQKHLAFSGFAVEQSLHRNASGIALNWNCHAIRSCGRCY
jgi:hypothetical protein